MKSMDFLYESRPIVCGHVLSRITSACPGMTTKEDCQGGRLLLTEVLCSLEDQDSRRAVERIGARCCAARSSRFHRFSPKFPASPREIPSRKATFDPRFAFLSSLSFRRFDFVALVLSLLHTYCCSSSYWPGEAFRWNGSPGQ